MAKKGFFDEWKDSKPLYTSYGLHVVNNFIAFTALTGGFSG